MPITGPFYDFNGAPYYYNTDTQQRVSGGSPGTNLGSSPALGAPAIQATNIPLNVASQINGATPQVAGQGGDLAALAAAFNSSGALTQQQINNQKSQFDANLAFQKQQMEQIGLPQLVIQQRLADLQQQQFQYQMYLTQQQQGLAQSGLGLQALQAQAQLGGPSNWVQAYNLAQGLKQTDLPVFEQRLLTGQQTPSAVGGAGLSTPQSLFTLAQQAGAGGGGGVPGVTINGQPVAGGQTSIGGQISPSLAPMPFLSQGGGGGGAFGAAGTPGTPGSYGGSSAPVFNAPGPNSPNDTARGSLMPGTTGMFQNATQNFGIGPGQGSNSVSGTRGTDIVGLGPNGLSFNAQFLQPKQAVFDLWDQTTGTHISDNSAIAGATKGTGTGWGGAYSVNVPGQGGQYTFSNVTPNLIDPNHMYRIRIALPQEGGGVGDAMEQDVSGATILGLQGRQQGATGAAAAQGASGLGAQVGQDASGAPMFQTVNGPKTEMQVYQELTARGYTGPQDITSKVNAYNAGGTGAGTAAPAAGTAAPTAQPAGPDMSGVYGLGKALFAAGGGALGPQALEGLGSTGTSMLQSVGQAVGGDWNSFLDSYLKSRIGQGAAQAA